MSVLSCSRAFEQDVLPHLDSVYNLARHLARNQEDAEDIVQEAYLRALRFYHRFRGGDARPWLLKIARNVFYTRQRRNRRLQAIKFEDDLPRTDAQFANPEQAVFQSVNVILLQRALDALPICFREVLVLREMEGMSYGEIATILGLPAGTITSRLSRARASLRRLMTELMSANTA